MQIRQSSNLVRFALIVAGSLMTDVTFGQEQKTPAPDEWAIRQRGKDYIAAVRRGNGDEIASFWTEEGDYVDETGRAVKGRMLARDAKGPLDELEARLTVTVDSIRFISADVAVEDGGLTSSPGALSGSSARRYTAIWVRKKGKWLLDGIRESTLPAATHFDRLRELDWMVGDWVSDDDERMVRLSCKWSNDKNFLLREIEVRTPQREPLHVTQRIGWDAREKQIKSWTFDSQGGHGDGLWFHKDDQWIIEAESVLANGSWATGTNVLTKDGSDAFTWESSNGQIDGEPVEEHKVRMTRTTSAP
jgi:ketosteroid isomerase-like protein